MQKTLPARPALSADQLSREVFLPPRANAKPRSRLLVPLLAGSTVFGLVVVLAVLFLATHEDPAPPAPAPAPIVGVAATPQPVPENPGSEPPTRPPEPVPPEPTPIADPVPSHTSPPGDTLPKPVDKVPKPADKPADPLKQLRRAADACRKTHKAVKGPPITIEYGIDSEGLVTRALPPVKDPLGLCLADAVKATKFAPQLKLGLKIDL